MTKFQRARCRNTEDARGRVRVQVTLLRNDPKRLSYAAPGNKIRAVTISDACVTEVMAVIEAALFDETAGVEPIKKRGRRVRRKR